MRDQGDVIRRVSISVFHLHGVLHHFFACGTKLFFREGVFDHLPACVIVSYLCGG